ncbi:MAG: DUF5717 family protein [Firmicutes bacterium]|nr:DUF5717 family protein [Bacillota bacterium]
MADDKLEKLDKPDKLDKLDKLSELQTKLDVQIANFEQRFDKNPTIRLGIGFALRYWLAFAVADLPEPRQLLYKAQGIVNSLLRVNKSDTRLFCLAIFFAIELNQYDKANEMLDNAFHYKSFYQKNAPEVYNILAFLYAYLEIKQTRVKSANKYIKILESEESKNVDNLIMLGILHSNLGNQSEAYNYFMDFYETDKSTKNIFWFFGLFNFYKQAAAAREKFKIREYATFLQVIYWALNHGANVENVVNALPPSTSLEADIALCERIHSQFPNPWLLKGLCEHYMAKSDYSQKAYACYRDAERRQITLPNLSYFLVQSAFKNGSETIQRYTMVQYLIAPSGDIDLQVYVYHLLLTEPNMSDLAGSRVKEILKLATYCLKNGIKGRYVNSLYYFLWINFSETSLTSEDISQIKAILQEDLCKFEIVNPQNTARYLYVNEWERQNIREYEFPKDGSPLVIEALSNRFRYTVLGKQKIQILDIRLEIRRKVASAGVSLYLQFYEDGLSSFEIIAYLAKAYLHSSQKEKADWDKILKLVLANETASSAFKTQCNVALGQFYYSLDKMDLALECYSKADENAVDDELLEHMLNAYIQQKAYKAAAGLLSRKSEKIRDKTLFNAIKTLSAPACEEWHATIAQSAYGLLLRMRYHKDILTVVLQHFIGTQQHWLQLHAALATVSLQDETLENLILDNAVWAHHFDEATQKIFARRVFDSHENFSKSILNFVYYSAYEVIIKHAQPIAETVSALEIIALSVDEIDKNDKNKLTKSLAIYALCHIYLENDIKTAKSEEIIKTSILLQKSNGILFPVFKDTENTKRLKYLRNSYLEKYRPLAYKTLPGKDVWLYYKVDGEDEWRSQPTKYWRFGLYIVCIPHFFNENLVYYFSEELPTGSITTKQQEVHNENKYLEETSEDTFFTINNATIYEQMFRYDHVEEIIGELVKEVRYQRNRLI